MTPERALELIPILQARADRKEIEYYNENAGRWQFASLLDVCIYERRKLRIKPEPEIIPFDYSDDLVGMVIMNKYDEMPAKQMIIFQNENGVAFRDDGFETYPALLDRYIKCDGSPCGKERASMRNF